MNVVEPLRERLVSAGVDMLEQVGAGQLGLRAIAREAGVSHGAPRRWFPTHNSLLAAIAARGYADLGARLEAIQGDSPRERLDRTCRTYVEFAVERPEMFTLMFRHDLLEGAGENLRATTTLPMFRRWRDLVATASAPPTTDGNPLTPTKSPSASGPTCTGWRPWSPIAASRPWPRASTPTDWSPPPSPATCPGEGVRVPWFGCLVCEGVPREFPDYQCDHAPKRAVGRRGGPAAHLRGDLPSRRR